MATAKKKVTKKIAPKKVSKGEGYKGHPAGTMKAKVHEIFDKYSKDPEKARAEALKINPNSSTVSNWFSQFRSAS